MIKEVVGARVVLLPCVKVAYSCRLVGTYSCCITFTLYISDGHLKRESHVVKHVYLVATRPL